MCQSQLQAGLVWAPLASPLLAAPSVSVGVGRPLVACSSLACLTLAMGTCSQCPAAPRRCQARGGPFCPQCSDLT